MNGLRFALGVDLGGTTISAGLFDESGRIHGELVSIPTEAHGPAEKTICNLLHVIDKAASSARADDLQLEGVGVGSTGPLDPQSGQLLQAESLPNLLFFPLGETVAKRSGLPVSVTNDGNAFALAEARFGAGKGKSIVVGVTLGTGCGCGIIIEGKIVEGATANSGEIYRAPLAGGNFDEVLSGRGLEKIFHEKTGRHRPGSEISKLADDGDSDALETFRTFGRKVAAGLGTIAAVLDPSVVVLGGSVSSSFRHFSPALLEDLKRYVAPQVAAGITIVPTHLGAVAGALGGAALVFSGETIR